MRTLLRVLLTTLLLTGPLTALARCGFEFGFSPGVARTGDIPAGLRLERAEANGRDALNFARPIPESLETGLFFDRQSWMNAVVTDSTETESTEAEAAQTARAGSILSPVHGVVPEDELRLLIPDYQPSRRIASSPDPAASEGTTTGAPVEVPEPPSWLLTATALSLLAVVAVKLRRHP